MILTRRHTLFAVCGMLLCATTAFSQQPPAAKQPDVKELLAKQFGATVDIRLDQPYAGNQNPRQMVDVFLPKKPIDNKPVPVVVMIHGGGWTGGDRKGYAQAAARLASTGRYAAVSVGYRMSTEAVWPAQIHDCKAAIRYIRGQASQWKIDPERLGATGASAGGHLSTLLGVSGGNAELEGKIGEFGSYSSRVQCVINVCGPTDMAAPLMQGEAAKVDDPAVSKLVGGSLKEKAAEVKAASPLTYVSKESVPILTIHGTKDARVHYSNAEKLHAALTKAGATSLLQPVVNAGHGIPMGPELVARSQAFWDKYLRGEKVDVATTPVEVP